MLTDDIIPDYSRSEYKKAACPIRQAAKLCKDESRSGHTITQSVYFALSERTKRRSR